MAVASLSVSVGPALRSGCSERSIVCMKSIISTVRAKKKCPDILSTYRYFLSTSVGTSEGTSVGTYCTAREEVFHKKRTAVHTQLTSGFVDRCLYCRRAM